MTILDLLESSGLSPRRVSGTHGGEYACACPSCGGRDRFRAWPEQVGGGCAGGTWYCRRCAQGGDCIEYLRIHRGMSYGEACRHLGLESGRQVRSLSLPREAKKKSEVFAPVERMVVPPQAWREHASRLLTYAQQQLESRGDVLAWLRGRGIDADAARAFGLGWLPGEGKNACYFRDRAAWGLSPEEGRDGKPKPLWIPAGLVIPAFGKGGEVLRLRVRRTDAARAQFSAGMKYVNIPGSSMHPLLLDGEHRAFVVVEAELDAMACAMAARRASLPVGALAVGTNMGRPDTVAHASLQRALAILVSLDFDAPKEDGSRPGAQGYRFWAGAYKTARRWPVPVGKDPGEATGQGLDLAVWLRAGLPPVFHHGAQPPVAPAPMSAMPVCRGNAVQEKSSLHDHAPLQEKKIFEKADAAVKGKESPRMLLCPPLGPEDSLSVLRHVGLRVEKYTAPDGEKDFRLFGHERWDLADCVALMWWTRRWGHMVNQALYG